jgi:hypothetical protein
MENPNHAGGAWHPHHEDDEEESEEAFDQEEEEESVDGLAGKLERTKVA